MDLDADVATEDVVVVVPAAVAAKTKRRNGELHLALSVMVQKSHLFPGFLSPNSVDSSKTEKSSQWRKSISSPSP